MQVEPDRTIVEMLKYAIQNPYSGDGDIKPYQRQWDSRPDLTLTLFLEGEHGYVSLTINKNDPVDQEMTKRIIVSLAPLSCLRIQGKSTEKYIVHRFRFNNPLYTRPIFASALDKHLPQTIKHIEGLERVREEPKPRRKLVSAPVSYTFHELEEEPDEPYWHKLSDNQCHICHRELTDPLSVRVSIGSVCRKHIEKREERNSKMWEDISRQELERIWTEHNIYERRRLANKQK